MPVFWTLFLRENSIQINYTKKVGIGFDNIIVLMKIKVGKISFLKYFRRF